MTDELTARPKAQYRVLVCDALAMVRQAIQAVLSNSSEFCVVDEATGARDSIAKAVQLKPDLVVMDVRMPDLDGAEAIRQMLLGAAGIKVLGYSSDSAWETADRMLGSGAGGYVVKGADLDELVRAARIVIAGGHYLSLALLQPTHSDD
jgi:two-component system invasion response regulator UvrY